MKSMAVFSYTPDVEVMLRHHSLLNEYTIGTVVTFREGVAAAKKRSGAPVTITDDIAAISSEDVLILMDNENGALTSKYKACAERALEQGVEILCSNALAQSLELDAGQFTPIEKVFPATGIYGEPLKDIPVPVIGVMGMGSHCSKLETMLYLKQGVAEAGYHPLGICANTTGPLYGMYSPPDFLWENDLSFSDKVLKCNRYFYELCQAEKPDALLLELPGGIMPFGRFGYNHFSELALLLSSAAAIDIGILNVYFGQPMDPATQEKLRNCCRFKFNAPLYGFCIARQAVSPAESEQEFEFYHLDDDYIVKHQRVDSAAPYPVLHISDDAQMKAGIRAIVRALEGNAAAI
ncbi:hypothetical protein [Zongyangia hominis]|uniref:TIGR04066 family peptide maturation system protein n=1 Tax=Zongyangia hominis TaxID=2763677 RepID=A0A926IAR5_9FIRM|nr:hypothetical protein [Zongyangia hominis]MBC8569493.1 hypothetical protein [Zongyangia hominis]